MTSAGDGLREAAIEAALADLWTVDHLEVGDAARHNADVLRALLAARRHADGGLREAVEAELDACRCTQQWSGFDKTPFINRLNCPAHGDDHTGLRRRLRAALAAHPEPEPSVVEEAKATGWDRAHTESCDMAGNCWGGGCPLHENPYRKEASDD